MRVLVFSPMVRFAMQHYLQCISNEFEKIGVEAAFILPKHNQLQPGERQHVVKIGGGGKLGVLWANISPMSFFLITREVLRFRPDCVHILNGEARFTSIWLLALCRILGLRSILSAHDPEPHPGATKDIAAYHLLGKLALRLPDDIVIHDKAHAPIAQRWGGRLHVFPFPDIATLFGEEPRATRRNEVLFFGRIETYKGLKHFVELGKRMEGEAKFVIAGKGEIPPHLMKEIVDRPQIFELLHRYVADEEMLELFDRARVVLLPYESATQSGIPAGAASRGATPIGFAVGGLANQISDVGGYVAPAADLDALETLTRDVLKGAKRLDQSSSKSTSINFTRGLTELYFHNKSDPFNKDKHGREK